MLNIGCHLSCCKGYKHMGEEALSINANTFQFFSRNPQGGKAKAVNVEDASELMDIAQKNRFAPLLAHAPYTLNPCAIAPALRGFTRRIMAEDIKTLEYLPGSLYNFHPGSHVGQGIEKGVELIASALNKTLKADQGATVLLETMSGKGSEVGSSFEELRDIIDRVEIKDKLGVCLDTCHIYSAGYDIVQDLDGVLTSFDKTIGLEKLKAIHLNDSLTPFASRKDRHAKIGQGSIGLEAIVRIINHPLLKSLPFYLETPHDELKGYGEEIELLKSRYAD